MGLFGARAILVQKPLDGGTLMLVWLADGLLNPWLWICYLAAATFAHDMFLAMAPIGAITSMFAASWTICRGVFFDTWTRAQLVYLPIEAAIVTNVLVILACTLFAQQVGLVALLISLAAFPVFTLPAAIAAYAIAEKLMFEPSQATPPQSATP